PRLLLAHSMGALVATLHLARHPKRYAAAVLVAPMFDINVFPWPKELARVVAQSAVTLGFGEAYAFSQGNYDPAERVFDPANRLTSDPARYAVLQDLWAGQPEMRLGGVTFGWLAAAFRAMDAVTAGDIGLAAVETPTLILSAPDDRIVDAASHAVAAKRFRDARLVDFPHAKHELLMERDGIRTAVWRAIDDFLADVLP
ncbi:MAG TPA: alpha/beta hydrolase, partial [Azospirillaceae bacterium]|nr:alpha/beta hydrolase [Azospirillaceae bacterium]